MFIDSHCHLQADVFVDDVAAVIARAQAAGVSRMVTIGWDVASSRAAIECAQRYENVYATVGVAPHDEAPFTPDTLKALRDLAQHPKVVALGEFGLDYHYNTWPPERQREVFEQQLMLAAELAKPVVIHNRDADEDMLATLAAFTAHLSQHGGKRDGMSESARGVMHCFSGSLALAQSCWALGFLISIAGPITYPKPKALPAVVTQLPLEALLIETDAPYLAPQKMRGKRNEPAYVRAVAEKIAELRAAPFEAVAQATTYNAEKLFSLTKVNA